MRKFEGDIFRRIPPRLRRFRWLAAVGVFLLETCCTSPAPSIEFTVVPEAGPGGAARMEKIAGRAIGAKRGQSIVLYARSGTWWLQPVFNRPFTPIGKDSTWTSLTHVGTEYAALLVDSKYIPLPTTDVLPSTGDDVIAVSSVAGRPAQGVEAPIPKTIHFSGYEWDVRQIPSDSAGVMHANSGANAWTDAKGWLHLKISKESGEWACSEIALRRSLGYGWYAFHLAEAPHLEPANVLGMFTWDEAEAGQSHREMDIELSQWGDREAKNAQFTIQPYYVPANVFRFTAPSTGLTHSFHWEAGRVSFLTTQGAPGKGERIVAKHTFTSGVPIPGNEQVHINLYIYGKSRTPQQNGVEVVIEKFEYLP